MSRTESRVEVPGGSLAVIDHGGHGPDVLLVHSACHSAAFWEPFAPLLTGSAHVVAVDLRGHGQSDAEVDDVRDVTDDLPVVVDALGLARPTLVGYDVGGCFASVAAAEQQASFGGLVVVDSPVVESEEAVLDYVTAVGADEVVDLLVERFGLGCEGPDGASLQTFLDDFWEHGRDDWLRASPDVDTSRRLSMRAMAVRPDGSWLHRPTPDTVRRITRDSARAPFRPGLERLAEVDGPVTVVTFSEGRNGVGGPAMAAFAAQNPDVELVRLDGDNFTMQRNPGDVAREVVRHLARRA